jgi:hypothetical protein
MHIPRISAMRFDRRKDGDNGGGNGDGDLNSGKSNSSGGDGVRISDVVGPPEGDNKAQTSGDGGGVSVEVDNGNSGGSSDDGETRDQVYGTG